MCWTTYKFPKRRKAKKDIPIFKILRKHQRAFFYPEFEYTLGKKYKTTKMKNYLSILYEYMIEHSVDVNKAFHSYSGNLELDIAESSATIYLKNGKFEIYHDYERAIIAYGVIPKGAIYYVNEKGEIVSNKIILYSLKTLNKTNKQ